VESSSGIDGKQENKAAVVGRGHEWSNEAGSAM